MPVSEAQRVAFFSLVAQGISVPVASEQAGISRSTGWRLSRGVVSGHDSLASRSRAEDLPAPKAWQDLSPEAQEALRDFSYFSERYLARRPSPWRALAAERAVEALLDKTDRSFIVLNVFPGSGKSTLGQDLVLWLLAGGGSLDPAFGRAQRFMLGHESKAVSTMYVSNLRRLLELRRPFYDKEQKRAADGVLALDFGRFRPDTREGEESLWAQDRFLVAQLGDFDVYSQEPTVQAASRESGFLGNRVDFGWWDDIATTKSARNAEIAERDDRWFEDEAETRIEPGGALFLVGHRLGPLDLFRKRLDSSWVNEEGESRPKYERITYPAHHDDLCDGKHRQWNGATDGCLTDEWRLNWREVLKAKSNPNYATLYGQQDADPGQVLVLPVWLEGGLDHQGYDAPGCYDTERDWGEFPKGVGQLVSVVTVDPSVSGWWAIEWWAIQPNAPRYRYLIEGARLKLQAGQFLDFDPNTGRHVGLLEELYQRSVKRGHPFQVLVVEANAAHKYLSQFEHFRRWKDSRRVAFFPHTTGVNKLDQNMGVEARLAMAYRSGYKRLPRKPGGSPEGLNYLKAKIKELSTWPHSATDDTVMADWFLETNLDRILFAASRRSDQGPDLNFKPAPYQKRQYLEASMERIA